MNRIILRFVDPQRAVWLALSLAVLSTGCHKYGVIDSVGNNEDFIDQIYTRPGTDIRIDIMLGVAFFGQVSGQGVPDYEFTNFTSAEKTLIIKALDSLTEQQLKQSGVTTIIPAFGTPGMVKKDHTIFVYFPRPRTLDPNLGNELLTAMGFPPATAPTASLDASFVNPSAIVTPSAVGQNIVTLLEAHGINITSPKAPASYVPITSKAGMQAVNSEYTLVQSKNPNKLPSLQDQVRPHGDVQIVPSDNQHN